MTCGTSRRFPVARNDLDPVWPPPAIPLRRSSAPDRLRGVSRRRIASTGLLALCLIQGVVPALGASPAPSASPGASAVGGPGPSGSVGTPVPGRSVTRSIRRSATAGTTSRHYDLDLTWHVPDRPGSRMGWLHGRGDHRPAHDPGPVGAVVRPDRAPTRVVRRSPSTADRPPIAADGLGRKLIVTPAHHAAGRLGRPGSSRAGRAAPYAGQPAGGGGAAGRAGGVDGNGRPYRWSGLPVGRCAAASSWCRSPTAPTPCSPRTTTRPTRRHSGSG